MKLTMSEDKPELPSKWEKLSKALKTNSLPEGSAFIPLEKEKDSDRSDVKVHTDPLKKKERIKK